MYFDRSRMPHASCTSFTRSTASEPATLTSASASSPYTNRGGPLDGADANREVEITSLYGTDTNVAWTGSKEANDYYTMDGTGSEVKGQAWCKVTHH